MEPYGFTEEEWQLIVNAPAAIGMTVAYAAESGKIGTLKEIAAVQKGIKAGFSQFGCPLIKEVLADIQGDLRADIRRAGRGQATEPDRDIPEQYFAGLQSYNRADGVSVSRQVQELLAAKVPEDEAKLFKEWVIYIAEEVAQASKEGDFLGIGGTRVSPDEEAKIADLKAALQL